MNNIKISGFQAFSMITLFLLGSTILVGLGLEVEENAWLLNIIVTTCGIGLFLLYIFLLKNNKWTDFCVLLEKGFGKWVGRAVLFLYSFYFIYIASRVVTDFAYFISHTLFYQFSNWLISLIFVGLVCYACMQGLEAIARTSEILFFLSMILIIILIILAGISQVVEWKNVLPLVDFKEFKLSSIPIRITFPYGEMIVFLLVFSHINKKDTFVKKGWIAVLLSGMILLIISEIIIAILGAKVAAILTYPLLSAIEMIEFVEAIQHIEILSVFIFFFVGFIKVAVFVFAGTKGLTYLLPKKATQNVIIYLVGIITFSMTLSMDKSLPEHLYVGLKLVPWYLHIPFQFAIPLLLFVILSIKKQLKKA